MSLVYSNAAYGVTSREEENTYESVVPVVDSALPQGNKEKAFNPAADEMSIKEIKVQGNCYAPVAILALVMAVFSLIVALVGVSYAPIELNNQQGQLSSFSQEVESQIHLSNEQCKSHIIDLHTHLNNSNQMLNGSNQMLHAQLNEQSEILQTQLNDSNQQIKMLQAQLNNSSRMLQAQLSDSNQQIHVLQVQLNDSNQMLHAQLNEQSEILQAQLNHSNQQTQILFQADRNIIARLQLGTISYPANSCNDIPQYKPSGEYWIVTNSTSFPVQVYCDMNRTSCS